MLKPIHRYTNAARSALIVSAILTVLVHLIADGLFWALLQSATIFVVEILLASINGCWWVLVNLWDAFEWSIDHSWVIAIAKFMGLEITPEVWYAYTTRIVLFAAWVFSMRFFAVARQQTPWATAVIFILGMSVFVPLADLAGGWWRIAYIPICFMNAIVAAIFWTECDPIQDLNSGDALEYMGGSEPDLFCSPGKHYLVTAVYPYRSPCAEAVIADDNGNEVNIDAKLLANFKQIARNQEHL
jgi:hypothetical protein